MNIPTTNAPIPSHLLQRPCEQTQDRLAASAAGYAAAAAAAIVGRRHRGEEVSGA